MPYSDLLEKLFKVNLCGGVKLGLENARRLQKQLHFPDQSFKTIHIAGTNGKGSVSTKIAHAFELAGYRVGLYTSPHISSFRERIRVNGVMIPEKAVESLLPSLFQIVETQQIPATFFELTTFLALLYFSQEKVKVAVLETGLGGRLDATNVIHPCLSVITSISLDHTDILGSTRECIAQEKGGIIKEGVPVIIGPNVPLEVIQIIASEKQASCIQVKSNSPLFEQENREIAREALNHLAEDFQISEEAIQKGLEARQPCRFERVPGSPVIILDVAHNPDGIRHLFQMVDHDYSGKPLRLLFGLSKNKDVKACLELIIAKGSHLHLVEAGNGRGASIDDLKDEICKLGVDPMLIFSHKEIREGICQAKEEAIKYGEILIICGSFFIMNEARQALGFLEPYDKIDLNEKHILTKDCTDKTG